MAVFGSSGTMPGDAEYQMGMECGAALARAGLAVATGGYGGTMEAVSRGASTSGGHVIGVTAPSIFPDRSGANEWVAEQHPAATLPLRVARLIEISDAAIAMPGSIDTLTELVVWNTGFVARFAGHPPYALDTVGSTWRDLVHHLAELLSSDASIVHCAEGVDEAVAEVTRRLAAAG